MPANIDWVLVCIAGAMLIFFTGRRSYLRTLRAIHEAAHAGDAERVLQFVLELHRSWTPFMLYAQWVQPGLRHCQIASASLVLGQYKQALQWARDGLGPRVKPGIRLPMHTVAMMAAARLGDRAEMDAQYRTAKSIAGLTPAQLAQVESGYTSGLHALGALPEAMRRLSPSDGIVLIRCLFAAGYYEQACRITDDMIRHSDAIAQSFRQSHDESADPVLLQRMQQHTQLVALTSGAATAAGHAFDLRRREDFDRYREVIRTFPDLGATHRLNHCNLEMLAAATAGREDEVEHRIREGRTICEAHPNDRMLHHCAAANRLQAWLTLGDVRRAREAMEECPDTGVASQDVELCLLRSDYFEALGDTEQQLEWRDKAAALMPGHYRLLKSPDDRLPLPPRLLGRPQPDKAEKPYEDEPAPTESDRSSAYGPVAPVISPLGAAMWPLSFAVLIPIIGGLAAMALIPLSIVLFRRPDRLPHDRRAAIIGLLAGLVSIVSLSSTVWHQVTIDSMATRPVDSSLMTEHDSPEIAPLEPETVSPPPAAMQTDFELADAPAELEQAGINDAGSDEEPCGFIGSWQASVGVFAILIVSIILHEIAHGLAAYWGGDPTAKEQNRFSINPLRHLSWVGSVFVPLFLVIMPGDAIIGWAKPVPVTPYRLRRPTRSMLSVSLAGVSVNLMLAFLASHAVAMLTIACSRTHPSEFGPAWLPFEAVLYGDSTMGVYWLAAFAVCFGAIMINTLLAGFNLLPIPPLDGFNFVRTALPRRLRPVTDRLAGTGMILLLVLMASGLMGTILEFLIQPAVYIALWPALPIGDFLARI